MKLTNFLKKYEPKKYWTKRQYVVNTCGGKLKKLFVSYMFEFVRHIMVHQQVCR